MRFKNLFLTLMALSGGVFAAEAAQVKVTMNWTSPTMTLADKASGETVNIGSPEGYVYSFNANPGTYVLTPIGTDGATKCGTIELTVEDKAEEQEFTVFIVTVYVTNKNSDGSLWTVDKGDYTIDATVITREGDPQTVTIGKSVEPDQYTVPVMNGNSLYATFSPSETLHPEYLPYSASTTLTFSTTLSGEIPLGVNYPITVPKGANVIIGRKTFHYVDIVNESPRSIDENGNTKTYNYFLPAGATYDVCAYMEGKLTQKGYFNVTEGGLSFLMAEFDAMNPKAINHSVNSNEGYETGDIFVNINPQGFLRLNVGETFEAHGMRTWQLTDTQINNHFMEPDFHYTIIGLDGKPSDNVITIDQQMGKAWAKMKAVGTGTVIVLVTYDALGTAIYRQDGLKTPFMGGQYWGAIWPENTAAYVVSVGQPESAVKPNMLINDKYNTGALKLAGKYVDAEHDVFYYLDSEEGAHYTFKPEGVANVSIAYPVIGEQMATYNGFGTEGVTPNGDGSYTLLLKKGRQIVKMTDTAGNSTYQILTAKPCHREISNNSNPGSTRFQPGDEVKIQYSGLRHPANKLSGIYNMSASVTYNGVPNGTSLILAPGQYTFGSAPAAQTVLYTIPEDYDVASAPEINFTEGVIQVNGYGDPIGNHRNMSPKNGRSANFTAVPHKTYFGYIPDYKLTVSPRITFDIKVDITPSDAAYTVTYEGKKIEPDNNGIFHGTYGTYKVEATAKGYRKFRKEYVISENDSKMQTFTIALVEAPGAWDGESTSKVSSTDGVYIINNAEEFAWFAQKANRDAFVYKAKLTADIDLGDFDWTPIGVSLGSAFRGEFDGGGHIIRGLYIDTPSTSGKGLFGYAGGTKDDPTAKISGLTVYGSVTAQGDVAGILGYPVANVTISECANYADITSVRDSRGGGIVGSLDETSKVLNCYNVGSVSGPEMHAGIVGENWDGVIENVFNIGTISNVADMSFAITGESNSAEYVKNAYALTSFDENEACTFVTTEQMASGEVAYKLGSAFGQQIGVDPHPVLGGLKVYYHESTNTYSNDESGIDDILSDGVTILGYYNVQGLYSDKPFEGFNIVKLSDGSVRKVFVK